MCYIEIVGLDGAGKSRLCRLLKWKLDDRTYVIHVPSHDLLTLKVVRYVSNEYVSPITRVPTYTALHLLALIINISNTLRKFTKGLFRFLI